MNVSAIRVYDVNDDLTVLLIREAFSVEWRICKCPLPLLCVYRLCILMKALPLLLQLVRIRSCMRQMEIFAWVVRRVDQEIITCRYFFGKKKKKKLSRCRWEFILDKRRG